MRTRTEQFGQARAAELADPVSRRVRLERAKRELEAEEAARQAEYQARMARDRASARRRADATQDAPPRAITRRWAASRSPDRDHDKKF